MNVRLGLWISLVIAAWSCAPSARTSQPASASANLPAPRRASAPTRACLPFAYVPAADTLVDDLIGTCRNEISVRPLRPAPVRYPDSMRLSCGEGSVMLRFIVDTLGRPDMGSLVSLRSAPRELVLAAREAVSRSTFHPASINGHRVRQWVTQPYNFIIATPCPP